MSYKQQKVSYSHFPHRLQWKLWIVRFWFTIEKNFYTLKWVLKDCYAYGISDYKEMHSK